MKKAGVLLLFLILFSIFFNLASAQEGNIDEKDANSEDETIDKEDVKEETSEIKSKIQDRTQKLDDAVDREITLSEPFQTLARIFLRVEEKVSLSFLIISLSLLIFFLIYLIQIIKTFSPFSEEASLALGITLTIILSVLGVINVIANFLIFISQKLKFLSSAGNAATLVSIILFILVLLFVGKKIMKPFRQHKEIEKAQEEGIKAGADLTFVDHVRNMLGKLKFWE